MSLWNNVKKGLSKVAPIAANAILPGTGGMVGGLVASILGVENEPNRIAEALQNATPEQILALKKMELDNQEKLIELGVENDRLYLQDRQNARTRETDIAKATGGKDLNLYILAWTNVIGFFAVIVTVIFIDLPNGDVAKTAIAMLFGALIASYKDVTGYFFGSSKSSADKTVLLANGK